MVSEAGYFLTKVNAIKQTTSTVFAQVDSGFNHLIRPMLYGSHHEIINISNPKEKNDSIQLLVIYVKPIPLETTVKFQKYLRETHSLLKILVLTALPWLAITILDTDLQRFFGIRKSFVIRKEELLMI